MQVIIPQTTTYKIDCLDRIITALADNEINNSNPNILNIYRKIENWEKQGYSGKNFPLGRNISVVMTEDDIKEALANSDYADKDDPLSLFIIGTLLDRTLYTHDIITRQKDTLGAADTNIDTYLQDENPNHITSEENCRNYLKLLGPGSIKYFLNDNGYKSIVEYNNINGITKPPVKGGRK